MEVAPFFVDFHHFLSIFTIFYRFSRFTHFCCDLHFVAIYTLFPQFFLAKIAFSATSHVFCMYGCIGCLHHRWSILSQQCNEISNVYCFMAWASSGYNDIHRKTSGEPLSCLKTNIKLTAARNSIKEAECHHSAFIAPCLDYGLPWFDSLLFGGLECFDLVWLESTEYFMLMLLIILLLVVVGWG